MVDVIGRAGATDDKTGVIVPVYPQSGRAEVFTWQLRALVSEALSKCAARGFAEPLDTAILDREDLVDRTTALRAIHRPESMGELEAAKKRLIFDEFLRMQVGLVARKRALAAEQSGIEHDVDGGLVPAFIDNLPFPLTGDQARTIAEIMRDLAGPAPMHRLLQGDVGSGKTVVALAALLAGVQGGYQGALMAPTEVLAEQHHVASLALLDGLTVPATGSLLAERPVRVELLTNRPAARAAAIGAALAGESTSSSARTRCSRRRRGLRLGVAVIDDASFRGGTARSCWQGVTNPIRRHDRVLVYGDSTSRAMRCRGARHHHRSSARTWIRNGHGRACARKSPRVTRRTSSARSSRTRVGSRHAPRRRSTSGCSTRSSAVSGSVSCTAR